MGRAISTGFRVGVTLVIGAFFNSAACCRFAGPAGLAATGAGFSMAGTRVGRWF